MPDTLQTSKPVINDSGKELSSESSVGRHEVGTAQNDSGNNSDSNSQAAAQSSNGNETVTRSGENSETSASTQTEVSEPTTGSGDQTGSEKNIEQNSDIINSETSKQHNLGTTQTVGSGQIESDNQPDTGTIRNTISTEHADSAGIHGNTKSQVSISTAVSGLGESSQSTYRDDQGTTSTEMGITGGSHSLMGEHSQASKNTQATPISLSPDSQRISLSDMGVDESEIGAVQRYDKCYKNGSKFRLDRSWETLYALPDSLCLSKPIRVHAGEVYGQYSSLSTEHQNKEDFVNSTVKTKPLWLDGVTLLIFLTMLLLVFRTKRFSSNLLKLCTDYRISHKHFEEDSHSENKLLQYQSLSISFILPIFIYGSFIHLFPSWGVSYYHLSIIFLIFTGKWMLKSAILKIVSVIALADGMISELLYNKQLAYGIVSIALFPIALTILIYDSYSALRVLIWLGGMILTAGAVFVMFRSFTIFQQKRVSIFFWFLYLCIFEISPYLALYIVIHENTPVIG